MSGDAAVDRRPVGCSFLASGGRTAEMIRDVTAEHLSAHRDAAVARLTGRLAGASDSDGVLRAGLAELATNWPVHRAMTASQVLSALDGVAALIPGASFTTVSCAIIDRGSGAVRYSCAGHLPAIVASADGGTKLFGDARDVPLATADVARPEAGTMLAPGDTVLLYTDGLVERRRCCLDDGIDRAREILADTHELPPAPIAERLADQLIDDGHDDDVAYLIYQHPGDSSPGEGRQR